MANEALLRLGSFLAIFAVMALWELAAPKRQLTEAKIKRWGNNLGLITIDTLLVKLLLPTATIGVAVVARQNGWGLLNYWQVPAGLAMIGGVLFLDLVVYLQHLLFHVAPTLWRLHMVHHADLDIDLTTGLRFHPIEIIISLFIKIAAVAALGPPVLAVLIFEIILNGTAMFNHGNVRLPAQLDPLLRLLVVTPDMHRVHHSVIIRETNSNFGFNFPWWDRLFGTYRAQPVAGHAAMTIGLSQYRQPGQISLGRLLLLPLVGDPGRYSLSHIGGEPQAPRQQNGD